MTSSNASPTTPGGTRVGPDEVELGRGGQPGAARQQARGLAREELGVGHLAATRWSASREASATTVLVGFTPADVTNTLPSAT